MLEEIRSYQISGACMTEAEKKEIIDMFECLITFALGTCQNGREFVCNKDSEIILLLGVLLTKMQKLGWSNKRLMFMISSFSYCPWRRYQDISLDNLLAKGKEVIGESLISKVADQEYKEKKTKLIESFTSIQREYYELLFIRGLTVTSVAKIMGKKVNTVSGMKKTLEIFLKKLVI